LVICRPIMEISSIALRKFISDKRGGD